MPAIPPIEALNRIATGEIPTQKALTLVHDALRTEGDQVGRRVYDALRSAMWKLLISRTYGAEMRDWYDLLRQSSSLLSSKGESIASERVRALADLALASARFGSVHSVYEMISKEHVLDILRVLATSNEKVPKRAIMDVTRLRDSNLSRILANMTAVGLVDRARRGRDVVVSITKLARDYLGRIDAALIDPPGQQPRPYLRAAGRMHQRSISNCFKRVTGPHGAGIPGHPIQALPVMLRDQGLSS